MASRYSLGTLLAIVIPISAVLLLSLLLLLILGCCCIKQKSHIRQLNKQVSFNAQNERYNLRKKSPSGVDQPEHAKLKVPWYQRLLYCGCCNADVSQPEPTPSAQEKGLHSSQGNSRANEVSRHNSQKKISNAPQKHEGRHEMKFLSGQQDDPEKSPSKNKNVVSEPSQYKGDPRASTNDRTYTGSAQPSRFSHSALPTKSLDASDRENAKYKKKSSRASSGVDGLEYGTPKEQTTGTSGKRDNTNGSPLDVLPPAPLNLNSQGIILTDEDTNQSIDEPKYFEKYQAEALEHDRRNRKSGQSHERDVPPREVLARDPMGRNAISRQDSVHNSSVYPASSNKSPVTGGQREDRFVNEDHHSQQKLLGDLQLNDRDSDMPGLVPRDNNRNSTQYKWLDPPINLARVHRGENKMSMVASFVEPLTPVSPVDQADQDRLDKYSTPEDKGTPGIKEGTGNHFSSHPETNAHVVPVSSKYATSSMEYSEDSRGRGMMAQNPKNAQSSLSQSVHSGDAHGSVGDSRSKSSKSGGSYPDYSLAAAQSSASKPQGEHHHRSHHQGAQPGQSGQNKRSAASNDQQNPTQKSVSRGSVGVPDASASTRNPYASAPPHAHTGEPSQAVAMSPTNDVLESPMPISNYSKFPKNQSSVMSLSVDGTSQSGDNSELGYSPNIVDQSPQWKPSPIATSSRHEESAASNSSPSVSGDNYHPIPRQSKVREERKPTITRESVEQHTVPQVPHAAEASSARRLRAEPQDTSRQSRSERSHNRSKDYSRDGPAAGYGSEWHRNRPDTASSVESEYTHGTYATAPSRAPSRTPYDTSREKEPMIPVHNSERPLDTPWRTRRSQSTSSRASSLLFSVSEKGHISSSSHRKKGSISSSTRTKHKDPSKLNKPLPKTPPGGGGKDIQDFADNATYDTNDTNSPVVSQAGTGSISLSSKTPQGLMGSQSQGMSQPIKNEDGVVANMGGMLFHAVFPYQPALEDELPLTPREVVKVYQVFDDGWCFARKENPTSGPAHGICPKVCLANISE